MFCENCEALGETCCTASKARRDLNTRLANLVDRQRVVIKTLTAERDAARLIAEDLMRLHSVAKP